MKLRTFTALLLAAIMLFALTACGSQAADDSSSDQQQEQQDTTTNESNEFRVGMECAYAPNNWQESEATDSNVPVENVAGAYAEGYDVQIAKAIAEGLGKELVIVKLSWDGLIDALNQGQIDAIIAGMMDTAERRESINFSEPYRETTYGLMVLADSPYLNATSIQDFSGAAVLGQQGTALDDVIEQIEGVDHLTAASVQAYDLRAGAAMVIAALAAEGTSEVSNVHYIERGYEDIIGKLRNLGAQIDSVECDETVETRQIG
mgnify:FL=1